MPHSPEYELRETPIYFQTRRESKYTIPGIALPPEISDKELWNKRVEAWDIYLKRHMVTREQYDTYLKEAGYGNV